MPVANTELGDGDEPEEADSPGERRQKEERVLRAVADTRVRYIDDEDESGTDTPESLPVDDDAVVKRQEALTRAAAETGIVGEFVPDVEEEAQEAEEKSAILRVPLSPALKQAIDSRMSLYTLLNDLACARAEFIASHPKLAEAVVNEFARQERERSKMPSAEQANAMRSKRAARRVDLKERIKKARSTGDEPPPLPPKHMTEAEQMADSQWSIIANSEEKALPKVIEAAFEQCRDEPLAKDLAAVKIDPSFIMGGGLYYLALENILESAQTRRKAVKGMLASAAPEKKSGFRLFAAREEDEDDDSRVDPPKLQEEDEAIASSIAALNQELADIEKRLIKEFWSVYVAAALHYIPRYENMPWSVRAYLRHGAVGYAAWWMPEHVREHVYRDCTEEVLHGWDDSEATTHILYADEYLRAVAELDCTPALDENLELNERNSPNWKADKALRKLIFSSTQIKLLGGLLESTDEKLAGLQNEHDQFAQEAAKILHGAKNEKQNRRDLQQKQQSVKVEMSKLKKLAEKIRSQTLSQMREAVADTEKRFDDGELPRPPVDFLVRRECDAVHKIARLLANLKERFMPLVVRDYKPDTDALDDRPSVNGEIAEIERRDPAVFLETLVPAKRKKDRVDLRVSPTIVILPSAGLLAYAWNPRGGPENGRLAVPTCFIRQRLRERQMTYLFADFRWDTSKASAGMDLMTSDTIVAAFMTVRWDWRKRSREAREKGLIFNDQNDRTNWRRVYEAYIQTAMDSGKKLYNRNYDFYERIIGRYFDLPEGLPLLKK
ncbi:MAG: hypothetical protein LBJ46_01795 [Planctomycetota bacterium]|nr:hypothetical protein [Planctomycetota bacterium]